MRVAQSGQAASTSNAFRATSSAPVSESYRIAESGLRYGPLRAGVLRTGSVGPKSASVGAPRASARWSGPVSPATKRDDAATTRASPESGRSGRSRASRSMLDIRRARSLPWRCHLGLRESEISIEAGRFELDPCPALDVARQQSEGDPRLRRQPLEQRGNPRLRHHRFGPEPPAELLDVPVQNVGQRGLETLGA